jgi:hypothetical protein
MNSQNILFSSIFVPVNASDRDQVMKSIAWTIDRDPKFKAITIDKICDSVWLCDHFQKNELDRPSPTEDGIIILNVTSSLVSEPYTALIRLAQPVQWNDHDDNSIDIVAVVVSRCAVSQFDVGYDRDKGLHLQQLSRVTRFLMNKENTIQIRAAQTSYDLCHLLRDSDHDQNIEKIAA